MKIVEAIIVDVKMDGMSLERIGQGGSGLKLTHTAIGTASGRLKRMRETFGSLYWAIHILRAWKFLWKIGSANCLKNN